METIGGLRRSHGCGELSVDHIDEEVVLMGWVKKQRDHGGVIFLDLRDRSGVAQVVFNSEQNSNLFDKAGNIRAEYVIAVQGKVQKRPQGTENFKMSTGEIEVIGKDLRVLNIASSLPFYPEEAEGVDEALRLRYRYLDLRRVAALKTFTLRHQVSQEIRNFLTEKKFLEVETPLLTRSTPEGARDYLVPSRIYQGRFYALPQSPQLFKQILMVAGFERYYQFARCFRDEDLRADRQPEFTQLDMEMSFFSEEEVYSLVEEMVARLFSKILGKEIPVPFPRFTYDYAMSTYGTDKPDTRLGMEIIDISPFAAESKCQVFAKAVKKGGVVKGICVNKGGSFTRRVLDELSELSVSWGARGLAWFIINQDDVRSPLAKSFTTEELQNLVAKLEGHPGDLLLFIADEKATAEKVLGQLRLELAKRLNLIKPEEFSFVWITDFPLLEYNEEEQRLEAVHHPFTSPCEEDLGFLETEPLKVRARAYDLILNGTEIGGGSIRNYRRDFQEKIFRLIGLDAEEAEEKFGFLLEAFDYGAPPHGGIAFGFDRLLMLMLGRETIRDVIAFPKTQSATCLLTQAPASVASKQLKELHLNLQEKKQ